MAENTAGPLTTSTVRSLKIQLFFLKALAVVFVLGSLGMILWIFKIHKGPSLPTVVSDASHTLPVVEEMSFQHSYEIKDMSMAIINKKGTRTAYSQFTLIFDCPDARCKKILELNRAKILDAIFEVGADFYVEDFEAPLAIKGFKKFKEGIIAKTTQYFGKQGPSLVVFKDWVMN